MRRLILLLALCGAALYGQTALSVSPSSGTFRPGTAYNFTTTVSGGTAEINLDIQNPFNTFSNPCRMKASNNDGGWSASSDDSGTMTLRSWSDTTPISNSQCTMAYVASSFSFNGTNTVTTFTVTFKSGYLGSKHLWVLAQGDVRGWVDLGTITVAANTAPVPVSLSGIPANVNYGTWFNVTFTCRDADGWADILQCRAIIGWGVSDSYTCDLSYFPADNSLGNLNDAHTFWQNQPVGTPTATANNSYCKLDIAASTATRSGTDVTIVARISPQVAIITANAWSLSGYVYVADVSYAAGGWTAYASGAGAVRTGPKLIIASHD